MTLDEAIKHAEEVAKQNEEDAVIYSNCKNHKKNLYEIGIAENAEKKCCKCAEEHRQLAEWLKELKRLREQTRWIPSAQPEPLTDKEQRIFLAAMEREEKVCEEVDRNYVREPYEDSLMRVCKEIRRKVKGALWT